MNEILLILLAIAPAIVVPLVVLSKCGGEPFYPMLEPGDAEIYTIVAEWRDYIQRAISNAFAIPPDALQRAATDAMPMRQLEYFSIVMTFDAMGLSDVSKRDET